MTQDFIYVVPDDPEELPRLAQWFGTESELRGRSRLAQRNVEPGEMGAAFDALAIAVSSGGMATVAVRSLFVWLLQRQKNKSVRIKLKKGDGQEATIDIAGIDLPEHVIAEVARFFQKDR